MSGSSVRSWKAAAAGARHKDQSSRATASGERAPRLTNLLDHVSQDVGFYEGLFPAAVTLFAVEQGGIVLQSLVGRSEAFFFCLRKRQQYGQPCVYSSR